MTSKPNSRERKLRYIDCLVTRARQGNVGSLNILLKLFDKLIYKIAIRIHHRTHGKLSVEELHEAGQQEFRRLTLMHYTPGGLAHFNRYIESAVHAEVWKFYRPLAKDYITSYINDIPDQTGKEILDTVAMEMASYALINLSQAEQKIVKDCVMNGRTCADEAKLLGVSKVRVSQVKNNALRKLKIMMNSRGINNA